MVLSALIALLVADMAQAQAPPPPLNDPTDHFISRRQVGTEALLLVGNGNGRDVMDVSRGQVSYETSEDTGGAGPVALTGLTDLGRVDSWASAHDRGVVPGVTEADLATIPGSTRPRAALEPGIAVATVGVDVNSSMSDCRGTHFLCLSYFATRYDADHRYARSANPAVSLELDGLPQPNDGTEIELEPAILDPAVGTSLVMSWISGSEDSLYVARFDPVRDPASGVVTSLELSGTPLELAPVRDDRNLGKTHGALAVGDFLASGHDQVGVAWAHRFPATYDAAQADVALLKAPAGGEGLLRHGEISYGQDGAADIVEQATPALVARHVVDDGSDLNYDELILGDAIYTDGFGGVTSNGHGPYLESLDFRNLDEDGLPLRLQHAPADDSYRNVPSQLDSVGDIDGDGADELVSTIDGRYVGHASSGIDKLTLSGPIAGEQRAFEVNGADLPTTQPLESAVVDMRTVDDQRIAPAPGAADPQAFPQVAVAYRAVEPGGIQTNLALFSFRADGSLRKPPHSEERVITDPVPEDDYVLPGLESLALDGRVALGDPSHNLFTSVEPMVILNAPPTHFDILDGAAYDPNFCYAGNQYEVPPVCFFDSEYQRTTTASTEVTSTAKEDWSVSAKVSGSVGLGKVASIGAEFRAGYGQNFTKASGTAVHDEVTVTVKARNTDKIYALVRKYDLLEYPVFEAGESEPTGYVLAATPHTTSRRWIDSSSPQALELKTNHQPGNILSYPEDQNAGGENPFISSTENEPFAQDEFELSDTSDYTYRLTHGRMDSENVSLETKYNLGGTISGELNVGVVEGKAEVSGDYSNSNLITSETKVNSDTALTATLGGIDESFGETAYTVKPFAYWTDEATLVMDYAVEPSVAPRGAPKTWWQLNYGVRPDVTLNLPRLLDYEKQAGISEDAARFISPGVRLQRGACERPEVERTALGMNPPKPGETLCLVADVQNYSLADADGPVEVEFYDADPALGGELIGSDTVNPIPARGSRRAETTWTPDDRFAGTFPRLFALVDSNDSFREIHEDNQKGFRPQQVGASTTDALHAPGTVTAERGDGVEVDVEWLDGPPGHTYPPSFEWRVYAYPEDGADPVTTTVPSSATGTTLDLSPGRWRLVVKAVDGSGTASPASHPSEPIEIPTDAVPPEEPPPVEPPAVSFSKVPAEGSYTGAAVRIEFEASEGAETECVIDGVGEPCHSPLLLSELSRGSHSIRVRAVDDNGEASTRLVSWLVDDLRPEISLKKMRGLTRRSSRRVKFSGDDSGGSGIAGYEMRTYAGNARGPFSGPEIRPRMVTTQASGSSLLELEQGQTVCAEVRSLDGAGNASLWSDRTCTSRAYDEGAFKQRGPWKRVTGASLTSGHAVETRRRGPLLAMRVGHARKVRVLAGRCRKCGRIGVEFRGRLREKLDLGKTFSNRRPHIGVFNVKMPRRRFGGRLRLVSLGGGKVRIDGVAVPRKPR